MTWLFGLELDGVKARLWTEGDKPDASENAWDERFSGPEGSIGFQGVADHKRSRVYFTKPGYKDLVYPPDAAALPTDGAIELRMEQGESSQPPSAGESGFIHTYENAGNLLYGFADDRGIWQLRGYSAYLLPSCVLKGEDIRPFLRRVKSYGANTIATLGAALSPWCVESGFRLDPREQAAKDAIAKTFDTCAEEQVRVCHMVASDFQYGGLSDSDKTRIWDEQCEIMAGRWNLFAACGKEANVNGWHPSLFPRHDLRGVLQAAGSAGEGVEPLQPARDFSMWETRNHLEGAGWHKVLDDAGAGMFEQNAGYGSFPATRCPIVMIEGLHLADTNPDHVGDKRETDAGKALQFGLQVGASCAGGFVLTSLGQEGKLDGPVAEAGARAQLRGMQAAFLR